MTTLDEDIARIAALRGRKAEDYANVQTQPISWATLDMILTGNPDPEHDLQFFDHLPGRARAFIREQPCPINATLFYELLHRVDDLDLVVQAVGAAIARRKT